MRPSRVRESLWFASSPGVAPSWPPSLDHDVIPVARHEVARRRDEREEHQQRGWRDANRGRGSRSSGALSSLVFRRCGCSKIPYELGATGEIRKQPHRGSAWNAVICRGGRTRTGTPEDHTRYHANKHAESDVGNP